ncbi:MAG: hypothetical protein R2795_04295 [Saprospiraceae bacterium]
MFNKTTESFTPTFKFPDHPEAELKFVGEAPHLDSEEMFKGAFFIILPKEKVTTRKQELTIEIWNGEELLETTDTNFLGPI